jgi:hypothetical protein
VNENPFEVLKLDPSASEEEIVRRAGLLRQSATEDEQTAIREAVRTLTGRPEERQLHALLAYARPVHDWPEVERFESAFRRPPVAEAVTVSASAPLDLEEFTAMLRPLLLAELTEPATTIDSSPVAETKEEILRQTVEGLVQLLPFEPGA